MSQQNETRCSKCGAENRMGARFCAKCNNPLMAGVGAPADNAWQPPPPPPTPPPPRPVAPYRPLPARNNRRMLLLLVGIGFAVTVLMVMLVWLLLGNNKNKELAAGTGTPAGTITPIFTISPLTPTPLPIATTAVVAFTPTITITPTLIPVPVGNNLLQNGNFLQPWGSNWQSDFSPTISNQVIENQSLPEVASGQGLYLRRTGPGYLKIWQTITVVPSQLLLTGQLKAIGSTDTLEEGTAGLMLIYRQADSTPIAWSIWLNGSDLGHNLPLEGGFPTQSPSVTWHGVGSGWFPLNVNLRDEFANRFPTIAFEQVAKIEVILFSAGTAGCLADACLAELWVADLALIQN